MRRGGMAAGCFAAYIPQGKCDPEGFRSARERVLLMLDAIGSMGGGTGRADGVVEARLCAGADAIEQAHQDGVIAVVPAVENGHAMGEDLGLLAQFRQKGACYVTLTHNGHNALADAAIPRRDLGDQDTRHGGLSGLGREAVAEMNRLGLLVDVSHLSRQSMLQAVMQSRTPVVATHSCVWALCEHPRNLDDTQLDALRDTEGLIQITAMPSFLKPKAGLAQAGVADFVDHLDYVVRRIGVAHVGISSDFDGGGAITGWSNAAETPAVTAELLRRGYGHAEIAAFWGGNFLRLLRRAEGATRF